MTDPAPTPPNGEQAQGTEVKANPEQPQPGAEPQPPVTPAPDPAPTPAPTAEEQAKIRVDEALKKVETQNERIRKAVELQSELVTDNPEIIHKVFKTDPDLANQIVERLWGEIGIKSYKQLIERARLEQTKEKNPELYETNREVAELKNKLEAKEGKEMAAIRSQFLKSKGITENEYDPNYKKLQESLSLLNPSVVKEDYAAALEAAHKLAFSGGTMPVTREVPVIPGGSSAPAPVIPGSKPQVTEQSSWLASQMNQKFGYKIDFNK